MTISGQCLCGDIRYSSEADYILSGNCHCVDCKKSSGSGYAPTMFFSEHDLVIHGQAHFYSSKGKSGQLVHRGFCPNCGSQLFGKTDMIPGFIAVRAGTLDDPSQYKPALDLFTAHASHWDAMDPALPKFEELPPQS